MASSTQQRRGRPSHAPQRGDVRPKQHSKESGSRTARNSERNTSHSARRARRPFKRGNKSTHTQPRSNGDYEGNTRQEVPAPPVDKMEVLRSLATSSSTITGSSTKAKRMQKRQRRRAANGIVEGNAADVDDIADLDDFLSGITPNSTKQSETQESTISTQVHSKHGEKLKGAKFRWLNEVLYTSKSDKSLQLFKEQPDFFTVYHEGFRRQVEEWPLNPVDGYVELMREIHSTRSAKAKNRIVVADMGCGDAKLARVVDEEGLSDHIDVWSFDLVDDSSDKNAVKNKYVTACDIASTPLADGAANIVIFCLSLMGTNFMDFIREAHRVLAPEPHGKLLVTEVVSRFPNVDRFIAAVEAVGFELVKSDQPSKMFVLFEFARCEDKTPTSTTETRDDNELMRPCLYKRR